MSRLLEILVMVIYWLQAFLCPFFIAGFIAFCITKEVSIPGLIPGAILGVILAEYIRRKIGLEAFFSRIYGPNEMYGKAKNDNDTKD
jgi:hypothetical protein